jgi:hypothetical protein
VEGRYIRSGFPLLITDLTTCYRPRTVTRFYLSEIGLVNTKHLVYQ